MQMNTFRNLALTLTAVTFLAACGGNVQKSAEETHEGHDHASDTSHAQMTMAKTAKVVLKDDKLNAVYQHYIHLTTALINGDVAEAKVAAQAIELGVKELSNGGNLIASTTRISEAKTIDAQRTAYETLSTDFIGRVKASGLSSGELYVDHCPMAMDDKGAFWLSNQKEIKNPYFGESMMTCGSVKETIR